jgi:ankyrin repeat protein
MPYKQALKLLHPSVRPVTIIFMHPSEQTLQLLTTSNELPQFKLAMEGRLEDLITLIGDPVHYEKHIGARDSLGRSLIHHAALGQQSVMCQWLLRKASPQVKNAVCKYGRTAAHYASLGGSVKVLQTLHEDDPAHLEKKDLNGATPLHVAAAMGHLKVVQWLHSQGVDLNQAANSGETPMHLAAGCGSEECVSWLLEQAPLHADEEIRTRLPGYSLLERGHADVFALDHHQQTPLHYAASNGHLLVTHLLVQCGASLTWQDMRGKSVFAIAQ